MTSRVDAKYLRSRDSYGTFICLACFVFVSLVASANSSQDIVVVCVGKDKRVEFATHFPTHRMYSNMFVIIIHKRQLAEELLTI